MVDDSDGTTIPIVVTLDSHYVPWTGTLLRSCLLANPHSTICFEVVHDRTLSEADCQHLAETATSTHSRVRFHSVASDDISALPTTPQFGTVVWLRFVLPELLVDRSRVIYLDSDTLVMSELCGLWNTALRSNPIAAVANVVEPALRPRVEALGSHYPGGFFNSGVLVMDLDRMRAERSSEHLFRAAVDHSGDLVWPDQDVLNIVYADRWIPLHPKWNTQNSFWAWRRWAIEVFGQEALDEATRQPRIRHFEGPSLSKPWHYLCPYPGRKQYRAVQAETPWARHPLEDRTAATRLIRLLRGRARYRAYARLSRLRTHLSSRAVSTATDSDRPGEGDRDDGHR